MKIQSINQTQNSVTQIDLDEMQRLQADHDRACHADILSLPVQQRLKHFVLHFAKYAGQLAGLAERGDASHERRLLTDSFIICLAAANSLGLRLSILARSKTTGSSNPQSIDGTIAVQMTVLTGRLAKACEAMDHVEAFDIRGELERGVVEMVASVMVACEKRSFDLRANVMDRWQGILSRQVI